MVDVEADLRRNLAESARTFVLLLRGGDVRTADAAVAQLVDRAFGSAERLRDAPDLLGEAEQAARALLTRAARYAEDPSGPKPPRPPRERPDASRYGGSGASAPAPGGVMSGGGCYSGEDPRPTS